jgi:hypothetical protein
MTEDFHRRPTETEPNPLLCIENPGCGYSAAVASSRPRAVREYGTQAIAVLGDLGRDLRVTADDIRRG